MFIVSSRNLKNVSVLQLLVEWLQIDYRGSLKEIGVCVKNHYV